MRIRALLALALLLAPSLAAAAATEGGEPPLVAERLVCRGNQSTSCDFILSYLFLSAGDTIDEREIREATLRLRWLRNFESVSIYLEKGSERGRAKVVVEVSEATLFTYQAAVGVISEAHSIGLSVSGKLTHYNLFGDGKILDFSASKLVAIDGPLSRGEHVGVEYIDPHVGGSKRIFASAGIWRQNIRREWDNGDLYDARQTGADLSAGVRLWSFSYLTAGYRFRPLSQVYSQMHQRDGTYDVRANANNGGPLTGFGWHSEDDAFFPTQGSRLRVGYIRAFDGQNEVDVSFRKNWQFGNGPGVWTFISETGRALSFQYARPIRSADEWGARRARWYVAPYLRHFYNKPDGGSVREVGMTAGVQFETHSFGIVHFYLLASGVAVAGDN
jgi:hypothetical protein